VVGEEKTRGWEKPMRRGGGRVDTRELDSSVSSATQPHAHAHAHADAQARRTSGEDRRMRKRSAMHGREETRLVTLSLTDNQERLLGQDAKYASESNPRACHPEPPCLASLLSARATK
jgi:hypothetical protein